MYTLAGEKLVGMSYHDPVHAADGSLMYHFVPVGPLSPDTTYAITFDDDETHEINPNDYPVSAFRDAYEPVAGRQPILEFSTDPRPLVRLVYAEGLSEGVTEIRASFSTDMDPASLADVHLVDGNGNTVERSREWRGDTYHQLFFAVSATQDLTGLALQLPAGVTSVAGVEMAGLPKTVSSDHIPVFAP
jgi:hypothetical protein